MIQREIKFRAWDIENKIMLSHEQIDQYDKDGVMHWMDIIKPDNKEGVIIMQYTGLKDKNGKEIYEGDIVKWDDNSNGKYWRVAVVIWYQGFAFNIVENTMHELSCEVGDIFKLQNFIYSNDGELEIIGNIHENPELLK